MKYYSLDVETANPDQSSICQIGIVLMENGKVIDSWDWLIDPEDYFDYFNMMVHEIAPESVEGKPTFPEKYDTLCNILSNNVVPDLGKPTRNIGQKSSLLYKFFSRIIFGLDLSSNNLDFKYWKKLSGLDSIYSLEFFANKLLSAKQL